MKSSSCNTNRYQTISSCFDITTAVYSGCGDNYACIIIQQCGLRYYSKFSCLQTYHFSIVQISILKNIFYYYPYLYVVHLF